MGEFQELRYPFDSLQQAFSGGYWIEVEAQHLTLGLVFLLGFINLKHLGAFESVQPLPDGRPAAE